MEIRYNGKAFKRVNRSIPATWITESGNAVSDKVAVDLDYIASHIEANWRGNIGKTPPVILSGNAHNLLGLSLMTGALVFPPLALIAIPHFIWFCSQGGGGGIDAQHRIDGKTPTI